MATRATTKIKTTARVATRTRMTTRIKAAIGTPVMGRTKRIAKANPAAVTTTPLSPTEEAGMATRATTRIKTTARVATGTRPAKRIKTTAKMTTKVRRRPKRQITRMKMAPPTATTRPKGGDGRTGQFQSRGP